MDLQPDTSLDERRARRSSRALAFVGLLASLLALLVSVGLMMRKVDAYHGSNEHQLWMFQPVGDREFTYAGRPVSIIDEEGPGKALTLVVRYGDAIERIPAPAASLSSQIPGLIRHQDWLRVLRFADHGRRDYQEARAEMETGKLADRLVLVVRRPPPGLNPDAMGRVAQTEWKFDLYEFKPEGGFTIQRLGWPESERQAHARAMASPGSGPDASKLQEGTWQYYAALMVMPIKPAPRFTTDAVRAMGWTLPSAAISSLAVIASLAAIGFSRRRATLAIH
jgi:hypothetical protein